MTAVLSTSCRECGKALTDSLSRRYGIGPDCRKAMSPAELTDALRRNQPGYAPKAKPASGTARANHAAVTAAADVPTCEPHGGVLGRCPQCKHEADPTRAAERIIAPTIARRTAAAEAAYEAWKARQP